MKKLAVCFLFLVVLSGCRARLNHESSLDVELMDQQFREVPAISKAQKVFVTATATSGQISVYIFLAKDKAEVVVAPESKKVLPKILAKQEKTAKVEMSVDIPANEEAVVMIMSGDGKKANVKLKINN